VIRAVVKENPVALDSRLSRFEHGVTPLQLAVVKKRDDILALLVDLGADLEAEDSHGQTALSGAIALGNREAVRRLQAAGARAPKTISSSELKEAVATLSGSTHKIIPMISVADVAATLDWYVSIGFTELGRVADEGVVNWGIVRYGGAEIMFSMHGQTGRQPVSLWFYTDQIDQLYQLLKSRQLDAARVALAQGAADRTPIVFEHEIEDMFYGARQFSIRDLNGYELYFIQSTA